MLPTGSSELMAIVRDKVSAINKKIAPKNREKINKILLLLPQMILTICGTIKPIKPITPQIETTAAIKREEVKSEIIVTLGTFTPRVCAILPPNCIIFKSLE